MDDISVCNEIVLFVPLAQTVGKGGIVTISEDRSFYVLRMEIVLVA